MGQKPSRADVDPGAVARYVAVALRVWEIVVGLAAGPPEGALKQVLALGTPDAPALLLAELDNLLAEAEQLPDAVEEALLLARGGRIVSRGNFSARSGSELALRCARAGLVEAALVASVEPADDRAIEELRSLMSFCKRSLPLDDWDRVRLEIETEGALAAGAPAKAKPASEHAEAGGGVTWQAAAALLEALRVKGERFTSQGDYAKRLDCSPSTVNKAIKNTPELQEWAKRPVSSTLWTESLEGAALDSTAQEREGNPADVLEQPDVNKAMAYLLEQARPEERARIHAMSPAEKRKLAELAYQDPDTEKRILDQRG